MLLRRNLNFLPGKRSLNCLLVYISTTLFTCTLSLIISTLYMLDTCTRQGRVESNRRGNRTPSLQGNPTLNTLAWCWLVEGWRGSCLSQLSRRLRQSGSDFTSSPLKFWVRIAPSGAGFRFWCRGDASLEQPHLPPTAGAERSKQATSIHRREDIEHRTFFFTINRTPSFQAKVFLKSSFNCIV